MNVASCVVLAGVLALAALAVWRTHRKGMPCECGGSCRSCGGNCAHHRAKSK